MTIGQTHLFTPGPTPIPEAVRRAMNVAAEDHRAPGFGALATEITAGLREILRMDGGNVFLFPGSGSAAWEAAITNTLNPGDRVLMARHGHFSVLWAQMAERLGLDVELIDVAWGAGCPVKEIERRLGADKDDSIKAVFVTHNETATGVTSDVAAVRRALDMSFHDALLFVDGVSSIGSIEFRMADWGVDLAVTGSQKGLMCPAGLGILGVSDKAMAAAKTATMRRAYFEFADMVNLQTEGFFPYTPPIPLLHGMRAAINLLQTEGMDNVIARHARMATGVRAAVQAWGLEMVAEHPTLYSNTVTAIRTPIHIDAREVIAIAHDELGASFGGGLGRLAGRVFRVGHLGWVNEGSLTGAVSMAEMALWRAGVDIELGAGIAAAQRYWSDGKRRDRPRVVESTPIAAE
ncbi:Serine-pyruvate aminotransferase [Roseibaca ekhonensis]|uniref:Serine-pyruvate aminotransferase n=1 Tax=Roseinatronobacter ekhonensis TaxID=254356 RepID=A0A3B0MRF7_9RHOB|nr:aminotransferase class V-fold PLP-dependent enzyme [Roseibaca ekhonensis]SUZ32189.1 Serine-pyruvate aminotransferase [Roseibaca ekhonensis]